MEVVILCADKIAFNDWGGCTCCPQRNGPSAILDSACTGSCQHKFAELIVENSHY